MCKSPGAGVQRPRLAAPTPDCRGSIPYGNTNGEGRNVTDAATDRAELIVEWRLNGEDTTVEVPGHWTLADALR